MVIRIADNLFTIFLPAKLQEPGIYSFVSIIQIFNIQIPTVYPPQQTNVFCMTALIFLTFELSNHFSFSLNKKKLSNLFLGPRPQNREREIRRRWLHDDRWGLHRRSRTCHSGLILIPIKVGKLRCFVHICGIFYFHKLFSVEVLKERFVWTFATVSAKSIKYVTNFVLGFPLY